MEKETKDILHETIKSHRKINYTDLAQVERLMTRQEAKLNLGSVPNAVITQFGRVSGSPLGSSKFKSW